MAKYNCGTFGQVCNLFKADIKAALHGKVVDHDNKRSYDASKEECEKLILDTFDELVYQASQVMSSGRALERIMDEAGLKMQDWFKRYMEIMAEEERRFDDYKYEKRDD